MGILIKRDEDSTLYRDAYEEALRIIRISEEVRISLERVEPKLEGKPAQEPSGGQTDDPDTAGKLTSSKLAQKLGMRTPELLDRATASGYLELQDGKHALTPKGDQAGIEHVAKSRFGPYFLWPEAFHPV